MRYRFKLLLCLGIALGLATLWGCPGAPAPGPTPACAAEGEACTENGDCCDGLECRNDVCATGGGGTAPIPAKNISLDLVGTHDPASDSYNDNCIGCHGDRTNEVALDGVTPSAHSTMLTQFGEGNDRCIACHQSGADFLSYSSGGLRKQVDIEEANCASCHGAGATPEFYAE